MEFVRFESSNCATGSKVVCRVEQRQINNKGYHWFGTAPACNVDASTCTRNGMRFVRASKNADGTQSACLTGTKVLCEGTLNQALSVQQGISADIEVAARDVQHAFNRGQQFLKNELRNIGCHIATNTIVTLGTIQRCQPRLFNQLVSVLNHPVLS